MKRMIKYSYQINRNEGNETVIYEPKLIPTEIPSLAYIEGPNSSGKSTLLNIIALGLNGINRAGVNKSLKDKMISLMDNTYQQIEFSVNIDNNGNQLVLSKDKDSQQIKVYELIGGKQRYISPELLEEKYNLIYDIPDNPIERLNQLTVAIRDNQCFLSHRISEFRAFVKNQLNQAKNSRDPEQIARAEKELKANSDYYSKLKIQLEEKIKYLNVLEKYVYVKWYRNYCEKVNQNEKNIKKQEAELKRSKKKISVEYVREAELAEKYMEDLVENYYKLTPMLKSVLYNESGILGLWDNLNFNDILKEKTIPSNYKKLANAVEKLLVEKKKNGITKEKVEQAEIWNKIIELLSIYQKKDILIPGVEKSIKEFIDILKIENAKYEDDLRLENDISTAIEIIREVNKALIILDEEILPNYSKLKETNTEWTINEPFLNKSIQNMNKVREEFTAYMNLYAESCTKKGINLLNSNDIDNAFAGVNSLPDAIEIKSLNEEKTMEKINYIRQLIEKEEKSIENLKSFIDIKTNELEHMKSKEPHKYQEFISELTDMVKTSQDLEGKFRRTFDSYINDIINGTSDKASVDEQQKKYYEEVSIYLGKKIGEVRHVDKSYKIKSINIIDKAIITEEDKIIRYADMGTGQSQCAYIIGKLNTIDNRKVIALFDEVAMMDKTSLDSIFCKMKELHKSGKLILGIVVQKADVISVREI